MAGVEPRVEPRVEPGVELRAGVGVVAVKEKTESAKVIKFQFSWMTKNNFSDSYSSRGAWNIRSRCYHGDRQIDRRMLILMRNIIIGIQLR